MFKRCGTANDQYINIIDADQEYGNIASDETVSIEKAFDRASN